MNYIKEQHTQFTLGYGQLLCFDLRRLVLEWLLNDPELLMLSNDKWKCEEHQYCNYCQIAHVTRQTYELCLAAVEDCSAALMYIHHPDERMCLAAVQQNAWMLEYVSVDNQTEAVCMAALSNNAYAIVYIKHPTPEMLLTAVNNEPHALAYIPPEHQSEEVCLAAVQRDGLCLNYVCNQTPAVVAAALTQNPQAEFWSKGICSVALVSTRPSGISNTPG